MLYVGLRPKSQACLLFSVVLFLSGCGSNTAFDYSIPVASPDTRVNFAEISSTAQSFSGQYINRANSVATTTQAFDLLTLAGGVGTVFGIVFRGSVREVEALSAGTASSYGIGSYYATRARANTYYNGAVAMDCVSSLADQANLLFSRTNLANVKLVYSTTQDTQKPTLQPLIDFTADGPMLLSGAMDSINGKTLSDATNASQAPDISTLRTTMLSQVQDAVTKQQAFEAAVSNQKPPGQRSQAISELDQADQALVAAEFHMDPSLFVASPPSITIDDIRPQIDFVASFNSAITACIAKAG